MSSILSDIDEQKKQRDPDGYRKLESHLQKQATEGKEIVFVNLEPCIPIYVLDKSGVSEITLTRIHFENMPAIKAQVFEQLADQKCITPVLDWTSIDRDTIFDIFDFCQWGKLRADRYDPEMSMDERQKLVVAACHLKCTKLNAHLARAWFKTCDNIDAKIKVLALFAGHCTKTEMGRLPFLSMTRTILDVGSLVDRDAIFELESYYPELETRLNDHLRYFRARTETKRVLRSRRQPLESQ